MEAYLDNSATTRVSAAVRDVIVKTMTEDYGCLLYTSVYAVRI